MTRSIRMPFQRALDGYLASRPRDTPEGRVLANTCSVFLGSPGGRHESAEMWTYRRRSSPHDMILGFVPYGNDVGLFCSVDRRGEAIRSGEGASVQFNLNAEPGLSRRGKHVVLAHAGRVTRGRGAIAQHVLVELINRAAPEAAARLSGIDDDSWPFELGNTNDVAQLVDRVFVYAFAIEQAKRLLSQNWHDAKRRGAVAQPLLPSLDDIDTDDAPEHADSPSRGGQGYGLTDEERRAVERHAELIATKHFVSAGFCVRRVGKPFDLECTRGKDTVRVEVKGTTGAGDAVELTIGEVRHARSCEHMALFVVSEIELDRARRPRGGVSWLCDPWRIDEGALSPLRFRYAVDRSRGRSPS